MQTFSFPDIPIPLDRFHQGHEIVSGHFIGQIDRCADHSAVLPQRVNRIFHHGTDLIRRGVDQERLHVKAAIIDDPVSVALVQFMDLHGGGLDRVQAVHLFPPDHRKHTFSARHFTHLLLKKPGQEDVLLVPATPAFSTSLPAYKELNNCSEPLQFLNNCMADSILSEKDQSAR